MEAGLLPAPSQPIPKGRPLWESTPGGDSVSLRIERRERYRTLRPAHPNRLAPRRLTRTEDASWPVRGHDGRLSRLTSSMHLVRSTDLVETWPGLAERAAAS